MVGTHDFRTLGLIYPEEKSTVRTISRWDVCRQGEVIVVECEADGFLRHQIRRVNALLIDIGQGRRPVETMESLVSGIVAGPSPWPSVPASGLCLMKVAYPDGWLKPG